MTFQFTAPKATTAAAAPLGGFSFGANTSTGFGAGFGAATSSATPSTGFSFGAPAVATAPAARSNGFGATCFGFGAGVASAAPATGFSFGAGVTTSSALGTAPASTGFSFGAPAPASAASTGFSFGAAAPATGFGATPATGFGAAPATGFGASTGFGFGAAAAPKLGTGGLFGAGTGFGAAAPSALGLPGAAQQQQQAAAAAAAALQPTEAFFASLSQPQLFGDERDALLARWHQLQAMWGAGRGFCAPGGAVEYRADNPFCRFKAVVYNAIPDVADEDGLVTLVLAKKADEVRANERQVRDVLFAVLGRKPNLSVEVHDVLTAVSLSAAAPAVVQPAAAPAPLALGFGVAAPAAAPAAPAASGERCELIVFVVERLPSGGQRRVAASELAAFLDSAAARGQLQSQLAVERVAAQVRPSAAQLAQYLAAPGAGLHPLIWQQAQRDNPAPERLLPVPLVGLDALHRRLTHQASHAAAQQHRLRLLAESVQALRADGANLFARLETARRAMSDAAHRALRVACRQEAARRAGLAISAEEEALRGAVERLQALLAAPNRARVRLREAVASLRVQAGGGGCGIGGGAARGWTLEPAAEQEVRGYLREQQAALRDMIQVVGEDSEQLRAMEAVLQFDGRQRSSPAPLR